MSDFRKLFLAFALMALISGLASAQVITCNTFAQPLTVRSEGLAEQTGDVIIRCDGGLPPGVGTILPQINISVTLSTNVTSRLTADPITEALLFLDDPQPGNQSPCAPASGTTVCQPLYAGIVPGTATFTQYQPVTNPNPQVVNIFQGVKQNDNTIVFLGVPIVAPGSTTRVIRIKNVRAAIAGTSAANGQIFAFVSIQNPPANLQLNNSTVNVGFVQQGLTFTVRNAAGSGGIDTNAVGVALAQCENFNGESTSLATTNTDTYDNSRSFTVRFTEGYNASFKVRDINVPLQDPPLNQQATPQHNNGFDPNLVQTVTESGFFNALLTSTNGLNRAGRADHGTRLRVVFNNVPANTRLYVSAHSLRNIAFSCASGRCEGSSDATAFTTAYGVAANSNGGNVAAGTVIANPLSDAEVWNLGASDRQALPTSGGFNFPSGARAGLVEVPITSGSGVFVWEIFGQDPLRTDVASFAVAAAIRAANNPGTGTVTVNGSFAPVATGTGSNTMSATQPIPRFADQSTATNNVNITVCRTNLLFPFVSNQAGFDTGMAISNTSADPFGTSPQSGNCELNYYGGTTGGGAAPSKQTTTTVVQGGQHMAFTLSSGGTNGIAATPGFQGYIIATCQFRYAHGFAFISDIGAQRLSHGYLALILDAGSINRDTKTRAETLGQ